jgi:hypothetical protein
VGQYIVMFILLSIPLVNIIMLFVWGFGSSVNPNKKNFARASLIMAAIGIVLVVIFWGIIGSLMADLMYDFY